MCEQKRDRQDRNGVNALFMRSTFYASAFARSGKGLNETAHSVWVQAKRLKTRFACHTVREGALDKWLKVHEDSIVRVLLTNLTEDRLWQVTTFLLSGSYFSHSLHAFDF